jgi:hypothetical protein
MVATAKRGHRVQSMVHHVNVIQSSEARLRDAFAAALPRPGPECRRIAGRAGQTIGAAANDLRTLHTRASLDTEGPRLMASALYPFVVT